ncbi:MAG: hypothetical protein A49_14170 [Methyloceanibacter sp.]|nr:MAG: hypothetical protein A49_14170 [Methyloceanibacter sp.]
MTKAAEARKRSKGRPSEYEKLGGDDVVPMIARQLTLLGATDDDIAQAFGVVRRTITTWKQLHKAFKDALEEGKEVADARVVRSLYERATGYSHPDVKMFCPKEATTEGEVIVVPCTKHYPPDTGAAIFWLKNRQGWRDRVDVNATNDRDPEKIKPDMSPKEAAERYADTLRNDG